MCGFFSLVKEISQVYKDMKEDIINRATEDVEKVVAYIRERDEGLTEMEERAENYAYYQDVLDMTITEYEVRIII